MELLIRAGGAVRYIYSESIDLACLGDLTIRRASHVEPDEQGWWWSDLAPVHGPRLGPFRYRTQALDAEQQWLSRHWLAAPTSADTPSGAGAAIPPNAGAVEEDTSTKPHEP